MPAVHPFAPPNFPPLLLPAAAPHQFAPDSVAIGRLGPIVAVRAGWGTPVDNPTMIRHYVEHGWDLNAARMAIESTGFTSGYYFPADNDIFSDETQSWHVSYIVQFVQLLCQQRGWDSVDVLAVGSCSSRNTVHQEAKDRLCKLGIVVKSARLYGQACNAALSAMDDLLRDDTMRGARAIVIGLETLSGGRIEHENPTTIRIFANGGGGVAFVVGEEVDFITGRSVVEYDTRGVVAGPAVCELPPPDQRLDPPAWHEIVGPHTQGKLFSTRDGGLFLHLPHTEDQVLRSDGMATAAYFARRTPAVIMDIDDRYWREFAARYGPLAEHPFSHQPSRPVIDFLNTEVWRIWLAGQGVSAKAARSISRLSDVERAHVLDEMGLQLPQLPQIDWYMPKTGFNNASAGTPMIILVQMMHDGLLIPNRATMMVAFGVGSVIAASVWRFLPARSR